MFLQVRLNSSRLPRKALLPLGDRSVIAHAVRALSLIDVTVHCILTVEDSAEELSRELEGSMWHVFCGPQDDVLARYVLAAREFGVDRIVRATGDNPLVSPSMVNAALHMATEQNAHYAGFTHLPLGSGVEILDVGALKEAFCEAKDAYEREHVAPFIYRRPHRYRVCTPVAPKEFNAPGTRVTLDTQEDYQYLQRLFLDIYNGEILDLSQIIPWLKRNPFNGS